jgi:hypothetical protein
VTEASTIKCANGHAQASAGQVRGVSLGSALLTAEHKGMKAHALFHVFEHPIKPLSNQWGTEHGGGYYLSVSPSSITLVQGETQSDFALTLYREDGSTDTVSPTRVVPCQPDKVLCSNGTVTALTLGPAALGFVYHMPKGEGADLCAVCYVNVITEHE